MSNEIIRPDAVNIIQDGLDNIVNAWGGRCGGSRGSKRVTTNEIATMQLINTWISWLRFYANNIGANQLMNGLNEVVPDTLLRKNLIDDIYSRTANVVNYCNRSECNRSECNKHECDHWGESDQGECNYPHETNHGEGW